MTADQQCLWSSENVAWLGWCLLAACLGVLLCLLWIFYLPPHFLMKYLARRIDQVFWFADTEAPVVTLSIDDTPGPSTEAILDVLKEYNVKAIFFIIQEQVPGYEATMKRIVAEGHELGNHLAQDRPSILDSPVQFEQNLVRCHQLLQTYQVPLHRRKHPPYQPTKWLRPGGGWFNARMLATAKKHAHRVVLGNCYPHDAFVSSVAVNAYYLKQRTRAGSIVILHDRPWTINVLKQVLPDLTSRFDFVSMQALEKQYHETSSESTRTTTTPPSNHSEGDETNHLLRGT